MRVVIWYFQTFFHPSDAISVRFKLFGNLLFSFFFSVIHTITQQSFPLFSSGRVRTRKSDLPIFPLPSQLLRWRMDRLAQNFLSVKLFVLDFFCG